MMDWIKCENELPPCDGVYLVTNNPENLFDLDSLRYDGYGFVNIDGSYREPDYWADIPPRVKRYGKQVELIKPPETEFHIKLNNLETMLQMERERYIAEHGFGTSPVSSAYFKPSEDDKILIEDDEKVLIEYIEKLTSHYTKKNNEPRDPIP